VPAVPVPAPPADLALTFNEACLALAAVLAIVVCLGMLRHPR